MPRFIIRGILLTCIGQFAVAAAADQAAAAPPDEAARVEALEKEVAILRREIAALREHARPKAAPARPKVENETSTARVPGGAPPQRANPLAAYAAAVPVLKAPPAPVKGELRAWVEGGGFWTGGEPVYSFFEIASVAAVRGTASPSFFALTPKFGWTGAAGFDYRFAGSPWHVSAQFRYGQAKSSDGAAFSVTGGPDPTAIPLPVLSSLLTQNLTAAHKETHWLADFAAGRDVLGSGPDAMQLKAGLRIAEVGARTTMLEHLNLLVVFGPVIGPAGAPPPTLTVIVNTDDTHKSTFRGAGPRIGVEGAAPIGRGWSLDYLADAAVLFGTHRFDQNITGNITFIDSASGVTITEPTRPVTNTHARGGTVFNADIQAGVSYWMNPMVKVSASYRLDAFFGALTTFDATNRFDRPTKIDRYFHGPRVAVTGVF